MDDRNRTADSFRALVSSVRDRCVQASCVAWAADCENVHVLEDWTRASERPDLTNFPSRLMNFEGFLLHNLQKILYISEATKKPGSPDIITPPPGEVFQKVRNNFVGGLYKVITGMKDKAENMSTAEDGVSDALIMPIHSESGVNATSASVDASNKVSKMTC